MNGVAKQQAAQSADWGYAGDASAVDAKCLKY
jgi:hypothetical protein